MQNYLCCMKDRTRRQIFTRFRTGSHWLQVQVGRFQGIARSNRLCKQCFSHELEDEEHCLLHCSHNKNIRARYVGLFTTCQNISLGDLFKKDQDLIAKYVEECYDIHSGSSVK
jgi:hypothetical protein